MPHRQRRNRSSLPLSHNSSDSSDGDSCFDTEGEPRGSSSGTDATDIDTDVEGEDKIDISRITQEDKDLPPEYYRNLEEEPESNDKNKDYKEGSLSLINGIEERFDRYCRYIRKDAHVAKQELTPHRVKAFFTWLLNQRHGKGGRRVKGLRSEDSIGTYYKYLRLAYKRATGRKIFNSERGPNRIARQILQKLSKKHGLSRQKRKKGVIYIEDLAVIIQTNLTTTKKKNRPQAILSLCYRHIIVTLLRDPNGRPHNILIKFTYKFTKTFLGTKDIYMAAFPFPSPPPLPLLF